MGEGAATSGVVVSSGIAGGADGPPGPSVGIIR